MATGFIAGTVYRPVTTTMITVAILVFGIVALTRLPVSLLPDLSYPSITVQTEYPDAAPPEVEELITRPVEELVSAIPGVVHFESVSREGSSEVVLDFAWGTNMDRAMDDVREKLDRVVLPDGAERPVVLRYDPAQEPIMRLALVAGAPQDRGDAAAGAELAERAGEPPDAKVDLAALRREADKQVKRALEKIPGVAAVQLHGGDEEEILVELDPARLAALRIAAEEIVAAIQQDNVNSPGGALSEAGSRYLIRTIHEARTPQELGATIVRSVDGAELRLRDVARVVRAPTEREELSLYGGREAVELAIYREGDANTVAVAAAVKETVASATRGQGPLRLSSGQELVVLSDQAAFIESAIREVEFNTLIGGLLAVCVLLFFLRDLRATLVIATTIPFSLLATFIPLQSLGVSLNLMSLGGLALGVGMLVDNAIVVLESIARVREAEDPEGLRPRETAIAGTAEVAPSVIASTLTTIAVFLPMAFLEGVAGQLVRDLSYTVSFSIASSMLVSLTLVPVLQAIGGAPIQEEEAPRSALSWLAAIPALLFIPLRLLTRLIGQVLGLAARPLSFLYNRLEATYPRLLRLCLRFRGTVLMAVVGLCVFSFGLSGQLGRTLLPEVAQGEFFVQVALPQGSSLERTRHLAERVIRAADHPDVASVFARVGSMTAGDSAAGTITGTHLTQINVRLRGGLEEARAAELERALFTRMEAVVHEPEASVRLGRPALFSFDAPIEVQIFGEDPTRTADHARRLLEDLHAIEGLADAAPDDLAGRPEVQVDFDRERLGRLGIGVEAAASAVQRAIQGEVASRMHAADRQLDIRVRLPKVDRARVDDVARIQVGVVGEVPVLLSAVAGLTPAVGPAEIRRINGRRGLRIRARLTSANLGGVAQQVQAVLDAHAGDDDRVQATIAGQAAEMGASLESLLMTAAISVFLIYVVMASSFESLHHPLLIMFTVPLSTVGVILACVLTQTPISAMVGIGAIILGGIVVNNAIVLINTVNHQRGQGKSVREALVIAGGLRVRPIIMTMATTVLGLLPMALGFGDGAALRKPLAVAVIGGLLLSTLLTLIVIPCIYSLVPGRRKDAWRELKGE
ncbi:MAG: efflux RND transporter permease subunit [Nannocystaceae bacterium]